MALGLLVDGKIDLAMSIVEHCIFEIKYYNKVLNGNRSYVSLRRVTAICQICQPDLTSVSGSIPAALLYRSP